jgi:hypothetical protein
MTEPHREAEATAQPRWHKVVWENGPATHHRDQGDNALVTHPEDGR